MQTNGATRMSEVPADRDGPIVPQDGPGATMEPAGRVVELAAQYLARAAQGEELDLDAAAESLADDVLRNQFRRLIGDARSVQELLPVQVRPGMILSGRYRVGPLIGCGGMGRVYQAFDRQLERTVAVKVLSTPGASSFDAQRQFRREAVLLAGLQHSNIVAVHEIAAEGDVNYIVMDLVKGLPLDEMLERARQILKGAGATAGRRSGLLREALGATNDSRGLGPAAESDWHRAVARIAREAAHTVESAHAASVVHRDIKPKNVLLREDGSPVLLDFGLAGACEAGSGDMNQGLFGTTSYLAPEQASTGHVGSDPRSDVYQLGVLLHEMLCLARPFDGSGPSVLMEKIARGDCRRPREVDPSIPFELEAICLRAMELDPRRRYQTARALREDLDRWLGGIELPHAASGGRIGRLVRGSRYAIRRHKVAAAAGSALLLGGLIGALIWVGGAAAPLVISPFRYHPDTGDTDMDQRIVSVNPGEWLGVVISTQEPLYVYVVSISGQPSPPTWLRPMSLQPGLFKPMNDDGDVPTFHAFLQTTQTALRLPAGTTQVLCSQIGDYDPANPNEGLWVFTSRKPHPALESWLDGLDEAARQTLRGVNYETARQLFASAVSTTRGEPVPRLTARQSQAMADSLTAAMLLGESEWPFDDPRRWSASWPVTH
jgi:hypothetical protein